MTKPSVLVATHGRWYNAADSEPKNRVALGNVVAARWSAVMPRERNDLWAEVGDDER